MRFVLRHPLAAGLVASLAVIDVAYHLVLRRKAYNWIVATGA